jgi:hypothetical protein
VETAELIHAACRSIASLAPSMLALEECDDVRRCVRQATERGYFPPEEDEVIRAWFARYLTMRTGLLETIDDLAPIALGAERRCSDQERLGAFIVAYTTSCMLVRAARFLIRQVVVSDVVRRKLNEEDPTHRIPSNQYTSIYRSLTSPRNAWRLYEARRFAAKSHEAIDAMANDPDMKPVVEVLALTEQAVCVTRRRYFWARLIYRVYSMRRRRRSAAARALYMLAEASGRVIAELRPQWQRPRIDAQVCVSLQELLQPGDVLVTRHDHALSNLLLPGYWPHVALYLGSGEAHDDCAIVMSQDSAERWNGDLCILEARKDGVLFRVLQDTLSVDAVAVIRPQLDQRQIGEGLSRAMQHEGKLYNFDFDFSRSDRLVCTELVYRAYDGVGPIEIPLHMRAGRYTLSAEDLISLAIDGRGFTPIAVFGSPNVGNRLVVGEAASRALADMKGDTTG